MGRIEVFSLLTDNYSTQVKNDWDNVINLVHKLIAECQQSITT